jgi:caffeoyl-CoA O-methyltransferase
VATRGSGSFEKEVEMAYNRSPFIEEAIAAYAVAHTTPVDAIHSEIRPRTESVAGSAAEMQIGEDQAVFMEMIARATRATSAVEVGTFTGSSSLAVVRGMGPSGHLLCCDLSAEWTAIAREFWERAGVADRIELRIGPGLDTLRSLARAAQFDLAFLDADKGGYPDYYEELVPRLVPGGLLLVDNVLQGGRVLASSTDAGDEVEAVRAMNDRALRDPRVCVVLLPIADGLSVIQRVEGNDTDGAGRAA